MKIIIHRTFKGKTPSKRDRALAQKPFTLVFDNLPTREALLGVMSEALQGGNKCLINPTVGYSVVHNNDEFNRKLGIAIATNTGDLVLPGKGSETHTVSARFKEEPFSVYYIASMVDGEIRMGIEAFPGHGFEIRYTAGGRPYIDMDQAERAIQALMLMRRSQPA